MKHLLLHPILQVTRYRAREAPRRRLKVADLATKALLRPGPDFPTRGPYHFQRFKKWILVACPPPGRAMHRRLI